MGFSPGAERAGVGESQGPQAGAVPLGRGTAARCPPALSWAWGVRGPAEGAGIGHWDPFSPLPAASRLPWGPVWFGVPQRPPLRQGFKYK